MPSTPAPGPWQPEPQSYPAQGGAYGSPPYGGYPPSPGAGQAAQPQPQPGYGYPAQPAPPFPNVPPQGGGFAPMPPAGGPGNRSAGKGSRIWGTVLIVLGVFPLLIGAAVFAAAVKNSQHTVSNPEFMPKAWHNLKTDQIFPAHLEDTSLIQQNKGWMRQGIIGEGSCAKNLQGTFLKKAKSVGCKRVLAATYVDGGGKNAATVALIVTDSYSDAKALSSHYSEAKSAARASQPVAPPVKPLSAPGTLAANWRAMGGGVSDIGVGIDNPPYVVAVTAGPVDLKRMYGKLPEEWDAYGDLSELSIYPDMADDIASAYGRSFPDVLSGKEKSWGV